jgi:hypothetical protein
MVNSKVKGIRGELELRDFLSLMGFCCQRGQQHKGGPDSPDVIGLYGVHMECKRIKKISRKYVVGGMDQSERESGEKEEPTLMIREDRGKWYLVMDLERWIEMYWAWVQQKYPGKQKRRGYE